MNGVRRRLVSLLLVGALAAGAVAASESGTTSGDQVVSTGMALATGGVNDRVQLVVALPGGGAAFLVSEADEQADLNGDGDTSDAVLHVLDGLTDEIRNLGHVVSAEPNMVAPVDDRRVAFISRNALMVHDLDDSTTTVISQVVVGGLTRLTAGELVFTSWLGGSNQQTRSLRVFDPADDSVIDTGLTGADPRPTADGFVVAEPIDEDGDGSLDDVRIATWNLATGTATITDTTSLHPPEPLADGTHLAFIDFENDTDHNGDGDTDDALAAVLDLTTGAVTTSDAALRSDDLPGPGEHGPFTALPDGRVAFVATDGDGGEHVVLDPTTGTVHRTGLPAMPPSQDEEALPAHLVVSETHVAFQSGGTVRVLDLTDGSVVDTAVEAIWGEGFVTTSADGRLALMDQEHVHVHDPATGTTPPVLSPRRAAGSRGLVVAVGEDVVYTNVGIRQGTVQQVVRVTASGAAIEVDVPFGWEVVGLDGRLGVAAVETDTDLNGDGDTGDHVLQVVSLDPDPDLVAPAVNDVGAFPDPVEDGEPMTLAATVTDSGGGTVAGAEVVIDGIDSSESALLEGPVEADDGAFDGSSEDLRIHLTHSPAPGTHTLCVWAWDDVGNTSTDTCTTFEVLEGVGPIVTDVTATPDQVLPGETVHVAATIDDTDTGGSFVAGGVVTIDGVEVAQLEPEPGGEFDMPVEYGEATVGPLQDIGVHHVCVTGVDRNDNWSASPRCVTVEVLDDERPDITDLRAQPAEIHRGAPLEIHLVATDEGRGGSAIVEVTATLDREQPLDAVALNGAFDEPTEEVGVRLSSARTGELARGHHSVCFQAWDAAGNGSAIRCVGFDVERDQVIGEGLIDTVLGGGWFSLLVERPAPDSAGTGTVEYSEGPFQFASDALESLEVEASHSAVITGTGRLNGQFDCSFVVEVTEGTAEGGDPGSFSIELVCGPNGLLRHSAAGPLTDGSIGVRGG